MSSGDDKDDDTTPPELIVDSERDGTRFVSVEGANEELRRIQATSIPLSVEARIDDAETRLDELEVRVLKLKHDIDNVLLLVRTLR